MGARLLEERQAYLQLIRAYRDHPLLWNKNVPEHFNRRLKKKTLEKLADILRPIVWNADGRWVSQKIASFKKCFLREHAKVLNGKKAGVNYEPQHWAYKEMLFLEDALEPTDEMSDDEDCPLAKLTAPSLSTPQSQVPSSVPDLPPLLPLVPAPQSTTKERPAISTNGTEGPEHCDTFLQLVAIKLKELGTAQRVLVEKIINDTLFYAEMGELTFDQLRCIENTLKNRHKT